MLFRQEKSKELCGGFKMHKVALLNFIFLRRSIDTRDVLFVHSFMNQVFDIGLALDTVANT